MNRALFARTLWLAFSLAACVDGAPESSSQPSAVLSERSGLQAAPATKLSIGGDCTNYEGNAGCQSDLCLRYAPGFPSKGVCSQRCKPRGTACPIVAGNQWECRQVWPSAEGWACAPLIAVPGVPGAQLDGSVP